MKGLGSGASSLGTVGRVFEKCVCYLLVLSSFRGLDYGANNTWMMMQWKRGQWTSNEKHACSVLFSIFQLFGEHMSTSVLRYSFLGIIEALQDTCWKLVFVFVWKGRAPEPGDNIISLEITFEQVSRKPVLRKQKKPP